MVKELQLIPKEVLPLPEAVSIPPPIISIPLFVDIPIEVAVENGWEAK
jgi:hypothetical protein